MHPARTRAGRTASGSSTANTCTSCGAPDFKPRNPNDDQFYRIVDVRNPSKPQEVGTLAVSGHEERRQRAAAAAQPQVRHRLPRAQHQRLAAASGPRVYRVCRRRRDHPRHLGQGEPADGQNFQYSPPFNGMTHTVMPLFEHELAIVTDECIKDNGADWPKLELGRRCADETNSCPSRRSAGSVRVFGRSVAAAPARITCTRIARARARCAPKI